jgi:glycosidase
MPDLNWKNKEVMRAMVDIAKFWLDKGVDGFRLDAFIHMVKDDFSKNVPNIPTGEIAIAEEYYANLPEVKLYLSEFISEIKAIKPDCFILGEAASATPELADGYIREDLCETVISFDHFEEKVIEQDERIPKGLEKKTIDAKEMKLKLQSWQENLSQGKYPSLYWNNHDMPRMVSRFGNVDSYREKSAKALATAMYLLRGIPVILYGEEIGMKNLEVDNINKFQSPKAKDQHIQLLENGFNKQESLSIIAAANKEASRGVMQWNNSEYAGFSAVPSWIGENQEAIYNVEEETVEPDSILNFYRELLALKKTDLFSYGSVTFLNTEDAVIAYKRRHHNEEALVLVNLTDKTVKRPQFLADYKEWKVLIDSEDETIETLAPYTYKIMKKDD